uniref:Cilia- and flagella-associated protein 300 n=1 Tax=Sphaeramia orbicularis TaxID=375764 RepID=A0A672YYW2_9TELE
MYARYIPWTSKVAHLYIDPCVHFRSMLGRLSAQSYSFDQTFYPYNCDNIFHICSQICGMFLMCVFFIDRPVVSVDVEVVPCTKVSMEMFDPLCSSGVCPDYDELRQMLEEEEEEEEDYCAVRKEEQEEFLFRLFKHLWLGGELCQYDNTADPYISTTKKIYKDLISVQKDPETKKISVISAVLKVSAYDESGLCYPGRREDGQTFAYMIIDTFKRHVTLFYHFYGIGNFTF